MLCTCVHTCRLDNNTTLYLMLDVLDSEEEETIVKVGHVQCDLVKVGHLQCDTIVKVGHLQCDTIVKVGHLSR